MLHLNLTQFWEARSTSVILHFIDKSSVSLSLKDMYKVTVLSSVDSRVWVIYLPVSTLTLSTTPHKYQPLATLPHR